MVIPGFTGLYRGQRFCIGFYSVVYWVTGQTGLYRGLHGCIGVYWAVYGFTLLYRGLLLRFYSAVCIFYNYSPKWR